MPSGFDPRQPYSLSLDCFKDVPAESRPALVYRRINGSEYSEIAKARGLEGGNIDESAESLYAALRVGLIDWQNQIDPATGEAVQFDPQRLSSVLDPIEAIELVNERLFGARVNGTELKNSGSPAS